MRPFIRSTRPDPLVSWLGARGTRRLGGSGPFQHRSCSSGDSTSRVSGASDAHALRFSPGSSLVLRCLRPALPITDLHRILRMHR